MSAPASAQQLPFGMPNAAQPLATTSYTLQPGDLTDSLGKPITGTLTLSTKITKPWQYLFGTFPQRSANVDPTFSLTAQATYSQSDFQQLADQVAALSKILGKST